MKKTVIFISLFIVFIAFLFLLVFKNSGVIKNIKIRTTHQVEEEAKKYAFENSPFYNKNYVDDKLIVLNTWATWCKPCIEEIPLLNQMKSNYSDNENITFLSLSIDRDSLKLKSFIDSKRFTFTDISMENFPYRKYILNHLDNKGLKSKTSIIKVESKEIPVTYLLRNQKVIYSHIGKLDSTEIHRQINNYLNIEE